MSPCFPFVRRKQNSNKEIFLVILGLDNSGKTTISLSIKGVSSDLVAPTIGFDRIEFAIDSFNINLYDLGGGRTIRDIWETYFAEVYGVIFVIDSSTPERLEECHEVLVNVLSHPCISGKPILFDSPKYEESTNLPELNQCNDIKSMQINPLASDEKNHSLTCSQLNSCDLLHQIKLACSIDLEFQYEKLSLDSYHGFKKEGLFIDLEKELHISVDDSKENNNTRTIVEKNDEVSREFSLSPSVSNGQKKDVKLQPEVTEMDMSKTKLQCDKDYSIPQTANGSARCVNRTPTVIHSLYEKNSSSVKKSVHQSFNVRTNLFEKVDQRDKNSSLSETGTLSKLTKGPSSLARIFVSNFNKLHPITDQKPEGSMSSISQFFTSEARNNSNKFYKTSVSKSNLKSSN
ncbi:ADP-ribosylation factor-like 13, arl13 [Schistosoma mansoni]|uniref:ADP-ribosylation factor-like 13, arl13 n=1 Tax=Schistosoma mansoni TaxID=6183 RepID=UPI00022DCB6F|nr:ADP-ribosylation factor-like 13, arl13 [Schistosoma mansoni]|eukprot:XP_018654199.1 ADP-ribosylation factor-like 13, arl13 [Schistosoma mansoni]